MRKNTRLWKLLPLAVLVVALAFMGCKKGAEEKGEGGTPTAKPVTPATPEKGTPEKGTPETPEKVATPAKAGNFGKTDEKVKVEFYVMSQCPFGVRVEDAIKPVLDKIGANVDFHLDFIADEQPDGTFKSLHGEKEVQGNIAQLCAAKYHADKHMDFVGCMNKNMRQIPDNWEGCATQTGLDLPKLKACFEGDEGKALLRESIALAKKRNARGSPTMFIADQPYRGGRSEAAFFRSICDAFKGDVKPEACANVPEPVKVPVKVLTDKRCKECRAEQMVARLKSTFEGLEAEVLDYATPEGKKLYEELKANGVTMLPAFLFGKDVEKAEGYDRFRRYLRPAGQYQSLQVGAKFDPTAEICDNKVDDTGNGKIDCDDPTCSETLTCRAEEKMRLDLFVMSQCPYGVKALNAMEEFLNAFGRDAVNFNIHFIASEQGDGFKALHGQPEVDENIRELCAIKHYPQNLKYMDYILCRNKDIRSADWQKCTGSNGIATDVIAKCFDGDEGKQLLRDSIKVTNALGFSASPTWMANNKYKFSGITADQIRQNFCRYNPGVKGCDAALTKDPGAPAGACGG